MGEKLQLTVELVALRPLYARLGQRSVQASNSIQAVEHFVERGRDPIVIERVIRARDAGEVVAVGS